MTQLEKVFLFGILINLGVPAMFDYMAVNVVGIVMAVLCGFGFCFVYKGE